MLLIDGHLDVAMNALALNRDLKKTALQIRFDEQAMMEQKGRGRGTIGLPDLRAAETAVSVVTVISRVKPRTNGALIDFSNHEACFAYSMGQLAWYQEMERQGYVRMIANGPTLEAHINEWKSSPGTAPLGFILSMEGADPIVEPADVHAWWDRGLRILSLAHYGPSKYAFGTASVGPVTEAGLQLLDEMSKTSMILDVTHLSDRSWWMAVERFQGQLIATHNNCRALVPGDRQFTDDQIKHLVERDGVIGAAFDAWMLQSDWDRGVTLPDKLTLEAVVDHVDHICQITGNANHVGMGTDLDGGYGTEQTPSDFDTYIDMQKLPNMFRKRGYSEADIENIFSGNWLRVFRQAWSV